MLERSRARGCRKRVLQDEPLPTVRVLVVTQYFWPESFRINDVALGLVERGHEVTVLTGVPNYPHGRFFKGYGPLRPYEQTHRGVHIKRVPLTPRRHAGKILLSLNYLSFALSASVLGPLLCRGSYDLILVYEPSPVTVGLPAIVLKRLKNLPIMFWVQDLWPESLSAAEAVSSERILGLVAKMVRFIYKRCDRVLVQSKAFTSRVEALGAKSKDIFYFPNWAEDVYKPLVLEDDAPERGETPGDFRVLYAGNIGAAQSFDTILEAAARLKDYVDITWLILGDGRMREWVVDRIQELGLSRNVRLMDSRPVEDMPRYFASADALLVSLRQAPIFSLTIPSKIQSYLASGRPILASLDGEGARVVHESGAGLTSPAQDVEALAEAVLEMYRMSPESRAEMGRSGREYFEQHFERGKLLDQLEGWMRDLVSDKA